MAQDHARLARIDILKDKIVRRNLHVLAVVLFVREIELGGSAFHRQRSADTPANCRLEAFRARPFQ
jgi:hypothetical protein